MEHIPQRVSFPHEVAADWANSNVSHNREDRLDLQQQSAISEPSIRRQRSLGSFIMAHGFDENNTNGVSVALESSSPAPGGQNEAISTSRVLHCASRIPVK